MDDAVSSSSKPAWNRFIPHPDPSSMPLYEPMNPEKHLEWSKLVPHPHVENIPVYEPMNPEKKLEWNKLVPHFKHDQTGKKSNWFHCYQVPKEEPLIQSKDS
mmetsp:Transcript_61716/g.98347  ORF Transcript_61716/g.98347 Transcript_61716/m.98347 type:complete len:102 (-) Transcript_61716:64-369(-)